MTAKIKLNAASGGGSFSLQAPSSSANNRVFTLPDSADATLLTSTASLGKILQVKQTVLKNQISQAGQGQATYVDISGFSIDITPSSASNKILISFSASVGMINGDGNGLIRVLKDGSSISGFTPTAGTVANGAVMVRVPSQHQCITHHNQYLDTAGGTSSITYKLQWTMESSRTIYLNRRGSSAEYNLVSNLTVMEVAA